jgi:hypothetical protein
MDLPQISASVLIPESLDHLVLGCSRLEHGIALVEERTGVRAVFGGVHPGRGTRNALLSLGGRCYLEVMAPDPAQAALTWFHGLPELLEPRLVGWVVHLEDVIGLADRLAEAGIPFDGPNPGARVQPGGRRLQWRKLDLVDDRQGILPSFISWDPGSAHPAEDAPSGCHLLRFAAQDPDPREVARQCQLLDIGFLVEPGCRPRLHARLAGPAGVLDLTS